jgi:hypothetical protein
MMGADESGRTGTDFDPEAIKHALSLLVDNFLDAYLAANPKIGSLKLVIAQGIDLCGE